MMPVKAMQLRSPGSASGGWITSGSWVTDGSSGGWGGLTLRQVIPASFLLGGSQLRFIMRSSTRAVTIAAAYAQLQAASGDVYDFASTPVQILFGGSPGGIISAGNTDIVTDPVALALDGTKAIVVSAFFAAGSADLARKASLTGWIGAFKSGNDASTVNASGYTGTVFPAQLINRIQVFQP